MIQERKGEQCALLLVQASSHPLGSQYPLQVLLQGHYGESIISHFYLKTFLPEGALYCSPSSTI